MTRTILGTEDIKMQGDRGAVMLIHGYTGIPGHFQFLAEQLNKAGFTVFAPRLPGHGTNRKDFLGTSYRDWLSLCRELYTELKKNHSAVSLGGLSMGGSIALILAAQFKPEKLLLYAPAVSLKQKIAYFSPFLRYIIPRTRSRYNEEHEDPDTQYLAEQYWHYHETGMIASVEKLRKMALKALPGIVSDTVVFVSRKDNTVPVKAADIIIQKIRSKTKKKILLSDSSHLLVQDEEKVKVAAQTLEWLSL
ncbi:MAG: alpha/beta hydrolase [Spirochaetia bacterium]